MPTVETFIVGPDAATCEQIRAELTEQARQKAEQAFEAGDQLHGDLWLKVGLWIDQKAREAVS